MGDDVQAIKAGILEIAHVFVVNKADREGADRTVAEMTMMLDMNEYGQGDWRPLVVKAQALNDVGIGEVTEAIARHRAFCSRGEARQSHLEERARREFLDILRESVSERVLAALARDGRLDQIIAQLAEKKADPYTLAEEILKEHLRG
jgi:LAO/AO transport system kinase